MFYIHKYKILILILGLIITAEVGSVRGKLTAQEKGLIGYWNFDEGEVKEIEDLSGKGNNGIVKGALEWVEQKKGYALKFSGDGYVECGSEESLNFGTGDFSFGLWLKTTATGFQLGVLEKIKYWSAGFSSIIEKGKFQVGFGTGTGHSGWKAPARLVNDDLWHHVFAVVNRGANKLFLYIDGKLELSSDLPAITSTDNGNPLTIGKYQGTPGKFEGLIDEVRIYNRALAEAEIQKIFKDESPHFLEEKTMKKTEAAEPAKKVKVEESKGKGLIGYWNFDGGKEDEIKDLSGKGNNGTVKGEPGWVKQKKGYALKFSEEGGYIELPDLSESVKNGFTFEVWLNKANQGEQSRYLFGSHKSWTPGGASILVWFDEKYTPNFRYAIQGTSSPVYPAYNYSEYYDKWTHIAITYDRKNLILFINGNPAQITSFTQEVSSSDAWKFGSTGPIKGTIDEVRLYNSALSGEEIKKHFSEQTPLFLSSEEIEKIKSQQPEKVRGAPPPPAPVVYTDLKNLYLFTNLVKNDKPQITIIAPSSGIYDKQALQLQEAIKKITGVTVPTSKDNSAEAGVPIKSNLICLGNRSTNKTIEELYNRFYTLLDLKYPGPEGYEVRSLHNPFGNGYNVLFAGASDITGVEKAAGALIQALNDAKGKKGELSAGWLMQIVLGKGIEVPKNLKDFKTWEESKGYGSSGYFGWNMISKRMAMYYMTGDEFQAKEFLRLAFPDAQAKKEIADMDGEMIENKDDPLAGPYHYNAIMMILFWDLIEESPFFTDEQRLNITNAFSRQITHRMNVGSGTSIYNLTSPPSEVSSRHGQWESVSLYCLGRYFQKYYPDAMWEQCMYGAEMEFAVLNKNPWFLGEMDFLPWYPTGIAPIFTYLLLSGERKPLENGMLSKILRGHEILVSGQKSDWAVTYGAIDYFHKTAYLMQDGRYIEYRNRAELDLNVFRLGQSFWPEDNLKPTLPVDLVNKWYFHPLTEPSWASRGTGIPYKESFQFGSYHSTPDGSGDFILIKGYNPAYRNPYHTLNINELRIDSQTLLQGFGNQSFVWVDGMMEPVVAMDAALRYSEVIGKTTTFRAEVPKMAFCNWSRTLAQHTGKYALIVDDFCFRTTSDNAEIQIAWEGNIAPTNKPGVLRLKGAVSSQVLPGEIKINALDCQCRTNLSDSEAIALLKNLDIVVLRAKKSQAWLEMPFKLNEKKTGEVFADFLKYKDRGIVNVSLDGKTIVKNFDMYSEGVDPQRVSLGKMELMPGEHFLRVESTGKNEESANYYIGLSGLIISSEQVTSGSLQPEIFKISSSDPLAMEGTAMEWFGPVKKDEHKIFFSLIARAPDKEDSISCARIKENASALALAEPAVAVAGEYEGINGELVILAKDHLYGKSLKSAGLNSTLVLTDNPVDIDWDFSKGSMEIIAQTESNIQLALADNAQVQLDGKQIKLQKNNNGLMVLQLNPGRHTIQNAIPSRVILEKISPALLSLLEQAKTQRQQIASVTQSLPNLPPLEQAFDIDVGDNIIDLATVNHGDKTFICAAEGKNIHILTKEGKELRTLTTDGKIRVLHWWEEPGLLLAGCADEKVIAFTLEGEKKWTFVSEMDPAVFRAGKQYWFKSAIPGIYGLYSGIFLNNETQAFIGSACTLEIIDEKGGLVKRLPVFWGPGTKFGLMDRQDGSIDLLVGRWPNDGVSLAVINNRTLNPGPRGFYSVPSGHTYIGAWGGQNRNHIFYEDLDKDGKKEVVSEINGVWNRITIWTNEGAPLYNVNMGPGKKGPGENIRDLDVGDINADGKKEILVATSKGLVIAFDYTLEKIWGKRLPGIPSAIKIFNSKKTNKPFIAAGCEKGIVVILDGNGNFVNSDKVDGKPTFVDVIEDKNNSIVLFTTVKGDVKTFKITN